MWQPIRCTRSFSLQGALHLAWRARSFKDAWSVCDILSSDLAEQVLVQWTSKCRQPRSGWEANSRPADQLSIDGSIGDLFRLYGEEYIRRYRPNLHQIKFILAVRLCKTPALSGHAINCKQCGHNIYIYHSCGHSQCPCCQSIKRAQWQDRLKNRLLKVPYTHTVFTLPHQLNRIARKYPKEIYNLLLRSAWKTVKKLASDPANLGAVPGMVSILHTFGSDMKYHLHCHTLITFGGLSNNQWIWPKHRKIVELHPR